MKMPLRSRANAQPANRDQFSSGLVRPPDSALVGGDRQPSVWISLWIQIALLTVAINAVLIQTIVTDDSPLKNIIRGIVLIQLIVVMLAAHTKLPGWAVALLIVSVTLLTLTGNTDQLTIGYIMLLVPAMWSVDERTLTRAMMRASVFALALIFAFLLLGITKNEVLVSQTWVSAATRDRATFGTAGVPFFMNVVYGAATLVIYYVYRWRLRLRLLITLATLGGATAIFIQTNGRGGYFNILIFCVLAILLPSIGRSRAVISVLSLQPVLLLAFDIWLSVQHGNAQIEQLFSFRPMLYHGYFHDTNLWDLFTSTTVKGGPVSTVDSSYIHLLYGAGILIFVFFCIMFCRAVFALAARGRMLEVALLTSIMVYSTFESILVRPENVFIVFAWYLIMRYGTTIGTSAESRRTLQHCPTSGPRHRSSGSPGADPDV